MLKPAGHITARGYVTIRISGKSYLGHRLAYLLTHGRWPIGEIDHINGNKGDNRITNLREVTRQQNTFNVARRSTNTSGYKGVSWCSRRKMWSAYGFIAGVKKHLGRYHQLEAAVAARVAFELEYHKQYKFRGKDDKDKALKTD